MDRFLDQQDQRQTALKCINSCCLFLQVTQLSDISPLASDQIESNVWLATKPMPSNDDKWPIRSRPDEASWSLWRKALSKSVCTKPMKNVLVARPCILTGALGFWLPGFCWLPGFWLPGFWLPGSDPRSSLCWTSYVSHSSQRLFQPEPPVALALQETAVDRHLSRLQPRPLQPATSPAKYPCNASTE